jgi:hypothetical protein
MNKSLHIFILFIIISLHAEARVPIKNLYIFIEPTTVSNHLNSKGKEDNDILYNSKKITLKIVKWAKKEKIKRIIINNKVLKKDINPAIFIHSLIKKSLLKKRIYNIGKLLGNLHTRFIDYELKSDNTLFVYIGDVNFVKKDISSHGAYLTSGWLTHESSPFVRKFFKADNGSLKNIPTAIINRTQLSLKNEKKREDFLIKLFSDAGMKVYYVGNSNMGFGGKIAINHITDKLKLIANKKVTKLKNTNADNTELCQIVYDSDEINVPGCGR